MYSKLIPLKMTHPPLMRALARVLWLCVISREGNFYKELFLNKGVSYFISPKQFLKGFGVQ